MFRTFFVATFGLVVVTASAAVAQDIDALTLPPGFSIDVYAADVPNARSMARSPAGTLFVSTRQAGDVYAVLDRNQDQKKSISLIVQNQVFSFHSNIICKTI